MSHPLYIVPLHCQQDSREFTQRHYVVTNSSKLTLTVAKVLRFFALQIMFIDCESQLLPSRQESLSVFFSF